MDHSAAAKRRRKIAAAYAAGASMAQVASLFGVSLTTVSHSVKQFIGQGRPAGRPSKKAPDSRSQEMRELYRGGKTLQDIGDLYGVTRERVRQILLKEYGIRRESGGQYVVASRRAFDGVRAKIDRAAARTKRMEEFCGCSIDIIRSLGNGYAPHSARKLAADSPLSRWTQQKHNARCRGIDWSLSLADWWRIWQESGRWEQRGRGQGYVMARLGDSGPYSVDNVYICTAGQNTSDSYIVHPAAERREKMLANRAQRTV